MNWTDESSYSISLSNNSWTVLPKALGKGDYSENNPTPEPADLQVPQKTPTDWSNAIPLRGLWLQSDWGNRGKVWHSAWYKQNLKIPSSWSGKKIKLHVNRSQSEATIFVNGKNAGIIQWPGGYVDISNFVNAGKDVELALFVVKNPMTGYNKLLKDSIGEKFSMSILNWIVWKKAKSIYSIAQF